MGQGATLSQNTVLLRVLEVHHLVRAKWSATIENKANLVL